jgi:formate-dependent nitrite reductase membrane component NrfD
MRSVPDLLVTSQVRSNPQETYHNQPALKAPHWRWLVITYFFLGGMAGGTQVIASLCDLCGHRRDRPLVRIGRYFALAAVTVCPILLILDLMRPDRFYNMLRVFKLRSPMSLGTWILTTFSTVSGLAAVRQAAADGLFGRRGWLRNVLLILPERLLDMLGMTLGFLLAGYTGVLISSTAVPMWARNRWLMGPLFIFSAASTAAAALTLLGTATRWVADETLHWLERADMIFLVIEMGLISATLAVLRRFARPLVTGLPGIAFWGGAVALGQLAPLGVQVSALLRGKHTSRLTRMFISALTLAGSYTLRAALIFAGKRSARDPHAAFQAAQAVDGRVAS